MNNEFNEKIESIMKIISELKSSNILISKELEKVMLQLQELKPTDVSTLTESFPEKKTNPIIKRVSDEGSIKSDQGKYNIQVVGLGTVKIE